MCPKYAVFPRAQDCSFRSGVRRLELLHQSMRHVRRDLLIPALGPKKEDKLREDHRHVLADFFSVILSSTLNIIDCQLLVIFSTSSLCSFTPDNLSLKMPVILRALFSVLVASVAAQNTLTSRVDVARAAATARTNSPTSNVQGAAFDRIAIIWLENTDYDKAAGDRKENFLLAVLAAVSMTCLPCLLENTNAMNLQRTWHIWLKVASSFQTISASNLARL